MNDTSAFKPNHEDNHREIELGNNRLPLFLATLNNSHPVDQSLNLPLQQLPGLHDWAHQHPCLLKQHSTNQMEQKGDRHAARRVDGKGDRQICTNVDIWCMQGGLESDNGQYDRTFILGERTRTCAGVYDASQVSSVTRKRTGSSQTQ